MPERVVNVQKYCSERSCYKSHHKCCGDQLVNHLHNSSRRLNKANKRLSHISKSFLRFRQWIVNVLRLSTYGPLPNKTSELVFHKKCQALIKDFIEEQNAPRAHKKDFYSLMSELVPLILPSNLLKRCLCYIIK